MSNVVLETLAIRKPIFYFNNLSASTDILKKIKGNFMFKKKLQNILQKKSLIKLKEKKNKRFCIITKIFFKKYYKKL